MSTRSPGTHPGCSYARPGYSTSPAYRAITIARHQRTTVTSMHPSGTFAAATQKAKNHATTATAPDPRPCSELMKTGTSPAMVQITQFRGPWYRQAGNPLLSLGASVQAGRDLPSFFGDSDTGRSDNPPFLREPWYRQAGNSLFFPNAAPDEPSGASGLPPLRHPFQRAAAEPRPRVPPAQRPSRTTRQLAARPQSAADPDVHAPSLRKQRKGAVGIADCTWGSTLNHNNRRSS